MKRVVGMGGNALAKTVSQVLEGLLELPNIQLERDGGVMLVIQNDNGRGELISMWKIGQCPPDGWGAYVLSIECGDRLIEDSSIMNSRYSKPQDAQCDKWGVAIRVTIRGKKRIVSLYGLTEEANEAILLISVVGKNYLSPEAAVKMVEKSQNELVLRLKRKLLS